MSANNQKEASEAPFLPKPQLSKAPRLGPQNLYSLDLCICDHKHNVCKMLQCDLLFQSFICHVRKCPNHVQQLVRWLSCSLDPPSWENKVMTLSNNVTDMLQWVALLEAESYLIHEVHYWPLNEEGFNLLYLFCLWSENLTEGTLWDIDFHIMLTALSGCIGCWYLKWRSTWCNLFHILVFLVLWTLLNSSTTEPFWTASVDFTKRLNSV